MINSCNLIVVPFLSLVFSLTGSTAEAVLVIIDAPSDNAGSVGDYEFITGNDENSSPGQVIEVLGGQSGVPLQNADPESGTNTVEMGELFDILSAGGITTANRLVFGFGINETGSPGSNSVDVTDLDMSFERSGGGSTDSFSLDGGGDNTLRVFNFSQGQNSAEARIQVNLGFDFMTEYSSSSTEDFTIFSSISNTSDGFEIYFLSSAFTAAAVPEPSAFLLIGFIATATCGWQTVRARKSSRRQSS